MSTVKQSVVQNPDVRVDSYKTEGQDQPEFPLDLGIREVPQLEPFQNSIKIVRSNDSRNSKTLAEQIAFVPKILKDDKDGRKISDGLYDSDWNDTELSMEFFGNETKRKAGFWKRISNRVFGWKRITMDCKNATMAGEYFENATLKDRRGKFRGCRNNIDGNTTELRRQWLRGRVYGWNDSMGSPEFNERKWQKLGLEMNETSVNARGSYENRNAEYYPDSVHLGRPIGGPIVTLPYYKPYPHESEPKYQHSLNETLRFDRLKLSNLTIKFNWTAGPPLWHKTHGKSSKNWSRTLSNGETIGFRLEEGDRSLNVSGMKKPLVDISWDASASLTFGDKLEVWR